MHRAAQGAEIGGLHHDDDRKRSKLEAEKQLLALLSEAFRVTILRPRMVYGKGCKGNYQRLSALAKKTQLFPDTGNKRSMLYIDHLTEFMRLLIENSDAGIFFPQNAEYVNTAQLVSYIAEAKGKKIRTTTLFNPLVRLLMACVPAAKKAFGNEMDEMEMSAYPIEYSTLPLQATIAATEE